MNMVVHIVIPIFAIILAGFLAGRYELVKRSGASALNAYVYYFALPALLFFSLSNAPVEHIANWQFIAVNSGSVLICFILTAATAMIIFRRRFPDVAMHGMLASYGNSGFLGIPLLVTAFGTEASIPAAIAIFIYDFFIISVVTLCFEIGQSKERRFAGKSGITQALSALISSTKAVLFNPITLSLLLGILVAFVRLPLPNAIHVFTDVLGAAAGPTALFSLGLAMVTTLDSFARKNVPLSINKAESAFLIVMKLIVQPLIAGLLIVFLFPLDGLWALSALIIAALPTGAVANIFAQKYKVLPEATPLLIVLSTIFSIGTLAILLAFIA